MMRAGPADLSIDKRFAVLPGLSMVKDSLSGNGVGPRGPRGARGARGLTGGSGNGGGTYTPASPTLLSSNIETINL